MPGCCLLNTCTFPDAPLLQLAAHLHCSKQSLLAVYSLPAACYCTAAEALLCCATFAVSCCRLVHDLAGAYQLHKWLGQALSGVAAAVRL